LARFQHLSNFGIPNQVPLVFDVFYIIYLT
jgi:hypothetical protein